MQSLQPHFWPNVGFRAIPTQKCRGINGHHRLGDDGDNSQPITICSTNHPQLEPVPCRRVMEPVIWLTCPGTWITVIYRIASVRRPSDSSCLSSSGKCDLTPTLKSFVDLLWETLVGAGRGRSHQLFPGGCHFIRCSNYGLWSTMRRDDDDDCSISIWWSNLIHLLNGGAASVPSDLVALGKTHYVSFEWHIITHTLHPLRCWLGY